MNDKHMKLENPARLQELKPAETLKRIGLRENHVLCDIGAGSGVFTLAAAGITKNKVYALEIDEEMLAIIGEKAKAEGLDNIEPIKVQDVILPVQDDTIDIALMVTVLHEIRDRAVFLGELKKKVRHNGRIAVIEFYKRLTPIGPPVDHRMEKRDVLDGLQNIEAVVIEDYALGDNFYCLVFEVKKQ